MPVNTGAMPADLLESTLFGHVKGAFTSALSLSKKGLFEVADGGTLFLDEIGTMSMEMQAKILRVLQDRKFMHLGGMNEIQVDVRIIAATNVDLRQAVKEGKFREDLFYRLNVITVELPPLRAAQERHSAARRITSSRSSRKKMSGHRCELSPEALRPLMDYEWPGNVRELENVIERALCSRRAQIITADLLPDNITGRGTKLALLEHRPDASLFEIIEDMRASHHHRHAGKVRLEPDRSRRALPHPALDPESEDQAAEY